MRSIVLNSVILACFLSSTFTSHAQLPALKEQPWLGYFIGQNQRKYRFGISSRGACLLTPLNRRKEPIGQRKVIKITVVISEQYPNGKTVKKAIKADNLISDYPATEDPKTLISYRGHASGGIAFQITYHPERDGFSLGGTILDKGRTKNPVQLSILVNFTPYSGYRATKESQVKAFQKMARRDRLTYETTQHERDEIRFLEEMNPAKKEADPFISAVIQTKAYSGLDFTIVSSKKSSFSLVDEGKKPLWKGFQIHWTADEEIGAIAEKISFYPK